MNKNYSEFPQKANPFDKRDMMRLRAACLMSGISLNQWVLRHRKDVGNAYRELKGFRNHPKAQSFRSRVREEFAI